MLRRIVTPSGVETTITYGSSVEETAQDRQSAEAAYLPFPVQVVRRIESLDTHSQASAVSEFSYHGGFYDRRQRRFVGFGRVERLDKGDAQVPDRLSRVFFHARPPAAIGEAEFEKFLALARLPYRSEIYGMDDGATQPFEIDTLEAEARKVALGQDNRSVYFVARRRTSHTTTERGSRAVRQETAYEYDQFGNVTLEVESAKAVDGLGRERATTRRLHTRYLPDTPAYLVGLPVETIERDDAGNLLGASRLYYDGPAFEGLPSGQASRGALIRREILAFTDQLLAAIYPDEPPDLASLGYVRVAQHPEVGAGWWLTEEARQLDATGNVLARRDPLGRPTSFSYDAFGIYPTRLDVGGGQVFEFAYEYRYGQMVRQVTPDGMQTRWIFDRHGQLLHMIRPQDVDDQPSLLYEHAPFASPPRLTIRQLEGTTGSPAQVQHHYFDGRGQPLQTRVELGPGRVAVGPTPVEFGRGQPRVEQAHYIASTSAFSRDDVPRGVGVTKVKRDALDRPVLWQLADGTVSERRYEAGAIHNYDTEDLQTGGPHFHTPGSQFFDAEGRLVSVVERPAPGVEWCTSYFYNALGMLTSATDSLGETIFTRRYDLAGRLLSLQHRSAGTQLYVLDAAGARVSERRGQQRLFRRYDPLGRLSELRFDTSDAVPVETYIYDKGTGDNLMGRLARVEGEFGSVVFSYTRCGKLKAKTRTFTDRPAETYTLSYTYNRRGQPTSVTYPDGHKLDLAYNQAGQPTTVGGVITKAEYNAAGYLTHLLYQNGIEAQYGYNLQSNRLTTLRVGKATEPALQHLRYSYDGVGNPTRIEDLVTLSNRPGDGRTYGYDALYRLIKAEGQAADGLAYQHNYRYDPLGNLLNPPGLSPNVELTFQAERLVGASDGQTFQYDDQGNLTTLDGWRHQYDGRNRLIESVKPDGTRVKTLYDHTGTRLQTIITPPNGPRQRTWFCDEAFVLNEDGSTEKYVFFNQHATAVLRSKGESEIIHLDGQGNPTVFSNLKDGSLMRRTAYFPYGGIAFETVAGATERPRYGYHMHPEVPLTGLTHFGARTYSPRLGRFLQPDPAALYQPESLLGAPRSLPAYSFVMGNPLTLRDPYGASIWGDVGDWFKKKIVEPVKDAIKKGVQEAGKAIGQAAKDAWGGIKKGVSAAWGGIKSAASWAWGAAQWAAGAAWDGIKFMGRAIATVGTFGLAVVDTIITWGNPLTWATFALDRIDSPFTNVASFILKFARSPITSTISIGVGLYGMATGQVDHVEMEKGLLGFEWNPNADFDATTFGSTVHLRGGKVNSSDFRIHETYHSYQYVGYGDLFAPAYAVGGGWGLLSSAMSGKQGHQKDWWGCGFGVSDKYTYGQPMEYGAEVFSPSGNCH